jgi:hypothetical protein
MRNGNSFYIASCCRDLIYMSGGWGPVGFRESPIHCNLYICAFVYIYIYINSVYNSCQPIQHECKIRLHIEDMNPVIFVSGIHDRPMKLLFVNSLQYRVIFKLARKKKAHHNGALIFCWDTITDFLHSVVFLLQSLLLCPLHQHPYIRSFSLRQYIIP